MQNTYTEINFDGIVGPSHNYSGLSPGNFASTRHEDYTSSPKQAALQGLEKMWFLASLGIPQGVLPPHERPYLQMLRDLGFLGTDVHLAEKAYHEHPKLLAEVSSASSMWAANSATITPSIDSVDEKVHITPANLFANTHRAIECGHTAKVLKTLFQDPSYFFHHPPLPAGPVFSDEGAANHMRFCKEYSGLGVHLFVYGRHGFERRRYGNLPARCTDQAAQAVARNHQLFKNRLIFAKQNQEAIDQGVFHADVAAISNQNVLIFHELAFAQKDQLIEELQNKVLEYCDCPPAIIEIKEEQLPLEKAVETYFFNSQLITYPDGGMSLIAPKECQHNRLCLLTMKKILEHPNNPIRDVHYLDVKESMQNGGGPACLRIRATLNKREIEQIHQPLLLTEKLYHKLKIWIETHYRDELRLKDIADPKFIEESWTALDDLTKILDLGSFYPFQQR